MKIPNVAKSEAKLMVGGLIVAGLAVWWFSNNAGKATSGAVNVVGDAIGGIIQGIGDQLGIPRTDPSKGAAAVANGDILASLTYQPALQAVGNLPSTVYNKANNPNSNPLYNVGASIGVAAYDAVSAIKSLFGTTP